MQLIRHFSQKLPADPRERFGALAAQGYAPLVTLYQEHGSEVVVIPEDYVYPGLEAFVASQPHGDAIVTRRPGLFVGAKSADCVTVLLWDECAGAVGAVHSGWRGTAANIAAATVRCMTDTLGATPGTLCAALGPCICAQCFETHRDVPDAMPDSAARFIRPAATAGKFHVDLPGIVTAQLRALGLRHIEPAPACTCCHSDRYWSHRAHGNNRGLQISLIGWFG